MKHLKPYNEDIELSKSRQYIEQKTITEIRDILVDVSDECTTKVYTHSRRTDFSKTLYQIDVNYTIEGKHSIEESEELFKKSNKITMDLFDSLKRLELLGYDILYRKISSWSLSEVSGLSANIQVWK